MPWARRSLHAPRPSSPRSMWPDTCTVGSARGDMHRRLLPCSKPMRGHRSVGRRYSLYRAGSRAAGECVCCLVSRARTVITVQRTAVHVHNIKQNKNPATRHGHADRALARAPFLTAHRCVQTTSHASRDIRQNRERRDAEATARAAPPSKHKRNTPAHALTNARLDSPDFMAAHHSVVGRSSLHSGGSAGVVRPLFHHIAGMLCSLHM